MKKLVSLFSPVLLFFTFSLVITSCEKVDSDYSPKALAVQKVSQNANAYDYIGEQHNQGLDYFVQNADFSNYHNQVVPIVFNFGYSLEYTQPDMQEAVSNSQIAAVINGADTYTVVRDNLVASNKQLKLNYVDRIKAAFSGSPATAAPVVADLVAIENAVIQDGQLTSADRESLLRGLAVGKSSAEYWYNQKQLGAASPWVIKIQGAGGSNPQARLLQWLIVAAADAIGATVGSPAGPTGAIVCSVIAAGIVFGDNTPPPGG
jgi:hypothetical protein